MKTLYESILDDEDVLIDDVKKSIAAIDDFIETHNLIIGDGTRYFVPGVYYKKI